MYNVMSDQFFWKFWLFSHDFMHKYMWIKFYSFVWGSKFHETCSIFLGWSVMFLPDLSTMANLRVSLDTRIQRSFWIVYLQLWCSFFQLSFIFLSSWVGYIYTYLRCSWNEIHEAKIVNGWNYFGVIPLYLRMTKWRPSSRLRQSSVSRFPTCTMAFGYFLLSVSSCIKA